MAHYYVMIDYSDGTRGTCTHQHRTLGGCERCRKSLPRRYRLAKLQPLKTVCMYIEAGMARPVPA